jgi:hypothetical protein
MAELHLENRKKPTVIVVVFFLLANGVVLSRWKELDDHSCKRKMHVDIYMCVLLYVYDMMGFIRFRWSNTSTATYSVEYGCVQFLKKKYYAKKRFSVTSNLRYMHEVLNVDEIKN